MINFVNFVITFVINFVINFVIINVVNFGTSKITIKIIGNHQTE